MNEERKNSNGMSARFVFFGTPEIAVASLEALAAKHLLPALIVTTPDKPKGRGLLLSPSPVAVWAREHDIPVLTPAKLSDEAFLQALRDIRADFFVLVAYGKILPQALLAIPPKGVVNMHPSLLPKHRGSSPIESQILTETHGEDVGVSVMLLDEAMDHGAVLAQQRAIPEVVHEWPMRASRLYPILARVGGELLAETLPRWVDGEIMSQEQDHDAATYCAKIAKEDGLLDLAADPETNYRKILAYDMWPRAYFFIPSNVEELSRQVVQLRVIITDAKLEDGELKILKVIPEGKKEMSYETFLRSAQ